MILEFFGGTYYFDLFTGAARCLTIFKAQSNVHSLQNATVKLSTESRKSIYKYLEHNPLTQKEKCDLTKLDDAYARNQIEPFRCSLNSKHNEMCIPPPIKRLLDSRQQLPIYPYRVYLINMIHRNQVIVISGETGSGKTTQIPQYILEDSNKYKRTCRIICTQPRRLAAISIADRVAYERGEPLGLSIGYQIRLESNVHPNSNLVYTTSGFLLRCLISNNKHDLFSNVSHIILDEVHERDTFTDFLLISIKDCLKEHPRLKIIIMSATMDSDIFTEYFNNCPIAKIPGRMFTVDEHYLAETLRMIGYTNKKIDDYKRKIQLLSETKTEELPPAMIAG